MKLRRLAVVLPAIALMLAACAWADETEKIHRTVPLAPGGTLNLENFSGRVTITGTDRSEVVVDAVRRAPQDRLDRVKLDIQVSDSTVTIQANKRTDSSWHTNNVVETEMDIQVPRHTNLEIHVFSSPVHVTDVSGNHRFHSFSAGLHLAGVAGPVKADTFSGDIDLQMAAATDRPDLDLHTFSGRVDLVLPSTVRADVDFDSFSGRLTSDVPLTFTTASRRSVKGEINASEGGTRSTISIHTFSGGARIHK